VSWGLHRCARSILPLVVIVACSDPPPVVAPTPPRAKVRLRAFTEPTAADAVAALGKDVFVAKGDSLERWRADGTLVELSSQRGLPGRHVLALAPDARRDRVWIVTDGGLSYYDRKSDTLEALPPSPLAAELGLAAPLDDAEPRPLPTVVATAAADDGVWIGHSRGLYYASRKGGWSSSPITDPVTALHAGKDGWLWVGTDRGLIGREPSGKTFTVGPTQGCDVVTVRWIAPAPGGVLVVGEDASGHQRVAIGRSTVWTSFKLSPNTRWLAGAAVGDRLAVLATDGLYAVRAATSATPAPGLLRKDEVRLLPAGKGEDAGVVIERLPAAAPAGARSLGSDGVDLLVGTDELGVARQPLDSARPLGWLRRAAMLDRAGSLTVLCQAKDDCWIATGAPRAWRWHGTSFAPAGPVDEVVLGMVRASDGTLYGFHRPADGNTIGLSRIDGETWTPINIRLETPGTGPEVSFAKTAPDGLLWIGLRYRDDGDLRPWGIATIDTTTGAVAYHHQSIDPKERKLGILPVPTTVVDAAFLGDTEVWMASQQGAVRMQGEQVTVWNESSQLESELLNGVAVTSGGLVFVATSDGVGTFDGERWRFTPELRFAVNDLVLDTLGRLWMATERGLAIFDGKRVRRLDVRRGMVENQILDVTLDEFGRVWTRGPHSLAVVTP